jgi:hypothetical protein
VVETTENASDVKPNFSYAKTIWKDMLSPYYINEAKLKRNYIVDVTYPYSGVNKPVNTFKVNAFLSSLRP